MCVLVAGDASLRHAEKSLVQIPDLNAEFLGGSYVFGIVTFVAGHARVLPDDPAFEGDGCVEPAGECADQSKVRLGR